MAPGGGNPPPSCLRGVPRDHGGTGRGRSPTSAVTAAPSPACSDLCPAEENPYEPLDPPIAVPSQKHVTDPPGTAWARSRAPPAEHKHAVVKAGATRLCPNQGPVVTHPPSPASGCWSREKLVLVGTVALGVSVLMNVLFLAVGSRHGE